MQNSKDLVKFLYNHHFIRYIFVGGTTVVIDFGLLVLLHGKLNINLALATSAAYWVSITYNFLLNRFWTFSISEKTDLQKHLIKYLALLAINYLFTVFFVTLMSRHVHYTIAKLIAIVVQITWTYPIYKKVIFVHKTPVEESSI